MNMNRIVFLRRFHAVPPSFGEETLNAAVPQTANKAIDFSKRADRDERGQFVAGHTLGNGRTVAGTTQLPNGTGDDVVQD